MTVYDSLREAGIEIDSHASDLYARDSEKTRRILAKYPREKAMSEKFTSPVDGKVWWEIPFSFDPYWAKFCNR